MLLRKIYGDMIVGINLDISVRWSTAWDVVLKEIFGEQGRAAGQGTASSPIDIKMAKATPVRNVIPSLKELELLDVKIDC